MAYGQPPRDRDPNLTSRDQINEPNLTATKSSSSFGYILGAVALAALLIVALSYGGWSSRDVDTTATTTSRPTNNAPMIAPDGERAAPMRDNNTMPPSPAAPAQNP